MEDKPWWAYACEIVIFACSLVLIGLLLLYAKGPDSPHMPFSASTAGLIAGCIGFGLLVWLVIRFLTGRRGSLVARLSDLFEIVWWWG